MLRQGFIGLMVVGCWVSGCHRPAVSMDPTISEIRGQQADYDRLWNASLDVLRRHLYTIDRLDPLEGVISTQAETSQQWFEFWRKDVDTPYDHFEASLAPTRRKITLNLEPFPEDRGESGWNLTVQVEKQKLRSPERQYNAASSALRIFSEQLPGAAGEVQITTENEYWHNVGRDSAFEQYLLKKILAQAKLPAEPAA